jgi:hypothetical protein
VKERIGNAATSLQEANRLFREGDLSAAMQTYLLLHEQRPMKMYADNALLAARKLGLGQFASIEDLRREPVSNFVFEA